MGLFSKKKKLCRNHYEGVVQLFKEDNQAKGIPTGGVGVTPEQLGKIYEIEIVSDEYLHHYLGTNNPDGLDYYSSKCEICKEIYKHR